MKDLDELIADARQIIAQPVESGSNFTDPQITIWLNDAYRLIALGLEIFPAEEAVYTTATELTLDDRTINANNIRFRVQPENEFREMRLITYDELVDLNPDFENEDVGQPTFVIRVSTRKLRFHPPLDAANDGKAGGVKIYELRMPVDLVAGVDVPDVPSAMHQLMPSYAAHKCFEFLERQDDSITQLTLFRSGLKAMKGVNRRTSRNAKRWRPGEHAGKDAPAPACERFAVAGVVVAVFAALVLVGVEGGVEGSDFFGGEEVGDLEKALEVEEEFFGVVHRRDLLGFGR